MEDRIAVGSIVRVPLSGRRVRGWVVDLRSGDKEGLKEIGAVSGAAPVFDRKLLESLEWAANHYVAPLSVLLAHATPPNLPKSTGAEPAPVSVESPDHPVAGVASTVVAGKKQTSKAIVGDWTTLEWLPALAPVVNAGRTVAVITATAVEAQRIAGAWKSIGSVPVVVAGGSDAEITGAWEQAQTPGKLVVGTPRIASWLMGGLGLAIVLEEGRRAMKERQTPTLHVRDLIRKRSLVEGFATVFFGPTPSVELLAAGAEVVRVGNRSWALVEVVDRAEDPPGSGYLSERVIAALRATTESGGRSFVFTHRRVGFASMRCVRCRTIRQCARCGTRVGRVDACPRCGSAIAACVKCGGEEFEEMGTIPDRLVREINSRVSGGHAGVYPDGASIRVGTERDLASLSPTDLVVAADVDGMLMAHGYRAAEEALRQLARLGNSLAPGSGRRMMLQTSHPDSDLIATLRRGDPIPYLEGLLVQRAREGVPPSTEMIAVEVRDGTNVDLATELGDVANCELIGPLRVEDARRWLVQGDLGQARLRLREVVGRLRESGATVRVDADPIDL